MLAEDRGARIARLLRRVDYSGVAMQLRHVLDDVLDLLLVAFDLLQTQDVRRFLIEESMERLSLLTEDAA